MQKVDKSESLILKECLELLALTGIFAWRNNTGGTKIGKHFVTFGHPGSSDIISILPNGLFLGIEVKDKDGTQSPVQQVFQRKVEENNGIYLLVRSKEELRTELYSISTRRSLGLELPVV